MKTIVMPVPKCDFDPTESGVPFQFLKSKGIKIVVATPGREVAQCDQRMLRGLDLGVWRKLLMADFNAQKSYLKMAHSEEFKNPISWADIRTIDFDGILLPGGHAPGMREYLESPILQNIVSDFFAQNKTVGAICHGVVLAARSKAKNSAQSVLYGYKTTSLLNSQEYLAWLITYVKLKNYYRTYPQTVENEVKSILKSKSDFIKGPLPLLRDSLENLHAGFIVKDRNYISARWPGDSHLFAIEFYSELIRSVSSVLRT